MFDKYELRILSETYILVYRSLILCQNNVKVFFSFLFDLAQMFSFDLEITGACNEWVQDEL